MKKKENIPNNIKNLQRFSDKSFDITEDYGLSYDSAKRGRNLSIIITSLGIIGTSGLIYTLVQGNTYDSVKLMTVAAGVVTISGISSWVINQRDMNISKQKKRMR